MSEAFTLWSVLFWFVLYVVLHTAVGYLMQRAKQIVEATPNEKNNRHYIILKKIFTWFPFIFLLAFLLEYA